MTPFEKQALGLVHGITRIDCGAQHGGNWRLPCPKCIEKEEAAYASLRQVITDELVRRHIRLGHDARDGNKSTKKKRASSKELAERVLRRLAKEDLLYQHHGNVCAREEAYTLLADFFEAYANGESRDE